MYQAPVVRVYSQGRAPRDWPHRPSGQRPAAEAVPARGPGGQPGISPTWRGGSWVPLSQCLRAPATSQEPRRALYRFLGGSRGPLSFRRARLTTRESSRAAELACQRSPPPAAARRTGSTASWITSLPPGCAGAVAQFNRLALGKMGSSKSVRPSRCGSTVEL